MESFCRDFHASNLVQRSDDLSLNEMSLLEAESSCSSFSRNEGRGRRNKGSVTRYLTEGVPYRNLMDETDDNLIDLQGEVVDSIDTSSSELRRRGRQSNRETFPKTRMEKKRLERRSEPRTGMTREFERWVDSNQQRGCLLSDRTFDRIEQNSAVIILTEKLKQIDIIDGNNPFSLYRFLSELTDIYTNDVFPFPVFMLSVRTRTKGKLAEIFRDCMRSCTEWKQVVAYVILKMLSGIAINKLVCSEVYGSQRPDESLSMFYKRVTKAIDILQTNTGVPGLISLIINGCNPEIRKDLFLNFFPDSIERLEQIIDNYDGFQKYKDQFSMEKERKVKRDVPFRKKKLECWHCKAEHLMKNCPEKKTNPQVNSSEKVTLKGFEFNHMKGKTGKEFKKIKAIFVPVMVKEIEKFGLMDTASSISICNLKFFNEVRNKLPDVLIEEVTCKGTTIDNRSVILNKIIYVPICFGTKIIKVKLFLLENSSDELIFGLDLVNYLDIFLL